MHVFLWDSETDLFLIFLNQEKRYLRSYFRAIDKSEREKVRFVSMDIYENYRAIDQVYFPNALCCADSSMSSRILIMHWTKSEEKS